MIEASAPPLRISRFGVFELDLHTRELRKAGVRLRLPAQSVEVLTLLLARPGDLVTREELRERLWPTGTFVDFDRGLNAVMNRLRETLGDSADSPRFIETVPRRGYRFIAPVDKGVQDQQDRAKRRYPRWTMAAGALLLVASMTPVSVWLQSRRANTQVPRREIKYTQATFSGDVWGAALSSDGRTVAYASGEPDRDVRVFVRDLATCKSAELWRGAWNVADIGELDWLPNGSQLIVGAASTAWLVSRFGGAPRRVGRLGAYVAVSPDGSQLAQGFQNVVGFSVNNLDGTRIHQVRLQGFRWLHGLDWNPPTNRISLLTADDNGRSIVWSVNPDGRDVRRLYSDREPIGAMCSSPQAGVLYLIRDRRGAQELVRVPLTGVQQPASTVLTSGFLTSGLAEVPFTDCSVSADGERLLYMRQTAHSNIWRLALYGAAPIATPVTRGTSNLRHPRVSPDKQWIVMSQENESPSRMIKMRFSGGEYVDLGAGADAEWSPDGRRLAFLTGPVSAPRRLWISDVEGRAPQEVERAEAPASGITWLPDGRLAWGTWDQQNYRIRDLVTGQEELLTNDPEAGWVFDPILSPRGERFAVFWNRNDKRRGLWVLSSPSREARFVAPDVSPIGWSENGDWIYAYRPLTSTVVRVSPRTTRVEPVGAFPQGTLSLGSCSMTPDREAILCSLSESVTDAWIIEQFDRGVKSSRIN